MPSKENQEQEQSLVQYSHTEIAASERTIEHLSDEEIEQMFIRQSEAEAAELAEEELINQELVLVRMTPFNIDFVDKESGELSSGTYVTFELQDGKKFRSASVNAMKFALDTARFIGVNPATGELRRAVVFKITLAKAKQGHMYRFLFKRFA